MYEPDHRSVGASRVLDASRLVEVFGDDRKAIREILELAIDSLRDLLEQVEAALGTGDRFAASAGLHEVKGVSANVGAEQLANSAAALETTLSTESVPLSAELVTPLVQAYGDFATEARARIDGLA